MNDTLIFFSAFITGLLGHIHCLGMCSGISILLSIGLPKKNFFFFHIFYNLGRIISYTLSGILVSLIGFFLSNLMGNNLTFLLKIIGNISLFSIGFFFITKYNIFLFIEKYGLKHWNFLKNFFKFFFPAKNYYHAIILGFFWGNIPCGLVYSVLIWSLSNNSLIKIPLTMFFFGLGTIPSMLISATFFSYKKNIFKNKNINTIFGIIMCIFSIYNIISFTYNKNCH